MLSALSILAAAAEGEHESSKTAFYVLGGALAVWAVVVSAIGMSRATFPGSAGGERGVAAISVLLVAAAMVAVIVTA